MCLASLLGQTAGSPSDPTPHSPAGRLTGCPKANSRGPKSNQCHTLMSKMVHWAECHIGECLLTSPAIGVGSLLIFLTSPGLIALSSLRGGAEIYWVLGGVYACCRYVSHQKLKWCHKLTRITGCRSPMHCGSPCHQSSSLLLPEEGRQEETDVMEVHLK